MRFIALMLAVGPTFLSSSLCGAADSIDAYRLSDRNEEVPFCYLSGGRRAWPIASGQWSPEDRLILKAIQNGKVVAEGSSIALRGLKIVADQGALVVSSTAESDRVALQLEVRHDSPNDVRKTQTLTIRPAPPKRPLTYLADFGDDVIRIFGDGKNGYRPINKDGFDQYFRRLQAHGISRLIVWQSPFPYVVDPKNYSTQDWQRYKQQAKAILENRALAEGIRNRSGFSAWGWIKQLMALRLMPELGSILSESASEHDIQLTASFRPFEAALTKYYVVPVFDEQGKFLWNFHPLCSPTVNYHPGKIGFAHYREVLRQMGRGQNCEIATVDIQGVENAADLVRRSSQNHKDLNIVAAPFAPLASESFVLIRQSSGEFVLSQWSTIRGKALGQLTNMSNLRFEVHGSGLRITGLSIPSGFRYLRISQSADSPLDLAVSSTRPALLWAAGGNRLGGENVFFAFGESKDQPEPTRVSGIPPDGHYHTEFHATEASTAKLLAGPERVPLKGKEVVISLGDDYSVEMMDFTQPAAREFAVKQLKTLLSYPAFDEIILNTRSHTQLAGYLADDGKSVQPGPALYRSGSRGYRQIGLDEAYAPRNASADPRMRQLADDATTIERITTFQVGEWTAVTCQTPEPYAWRFIRNRLVADGVRELLLELREEFPVTRIRAVIPPSAKCVERVLENLERMKNPQGMPFGRDYYRRLWCSNNHIPNIGEGMAMVDLTGTKVEPVILGTGGYSQEPSTFHMYVRDCIADLKSNRGSDFRGPRSYFYEGQSTLRANDKASARRNREEIICHLLGQSDEIGEVILYEAADWTYFLPLTDPDLCGHSFLQRCDR